MSQNYYFKENIIKNILILIVAAGFYPVIFSSIALIKFEQTNDFLLIISMLIMTACFANFAFTYKESKLQTRSKKLLAHFATGTYMLLIALLLESMTLAVKIVYPSFHSLIFFFAILMYFGVIL